MIKTTSLLLPIISQACLINLHSNYVDNAGKRSMIHANDIGND